MLNNKKMFNADNSSQVARVLNEEINATVTMHIDKNVYMFTVDNVNMLNNDVDSVHMLDATGISIVHMNFPRYQILGSHIDDMISSAGINY